MFQSLPNLYEQVNSGCIMEILTLISMSMQKKPLLYLDQRYLNVHYRLRHVSRFE